MLGREIKKVLKNGGIVVGTSLAELGTPMIGKILGRAGYDWIGVEMEHVQLNAETLFNLIMSANSVNLPVVVKVPELSRNWVSRSLDAGASGVRLPWTETREEVRKLVEWSKYPPVGKRALWLGANSDYLDVDPAQYIMEANDSTLIFAHVETKRGVENIDEIVSEEHVDVVIVGSYDLSISLGVPGRLEHPTMLKAVDRLIESCESQGVAPGIYVDDSEMAKRWIERGMRCIECSNDRFMLFDKASSTLKKIKNFVYEVNAPRS